MPSTIDQYVSTQNTIGQPAMQLSGQVVRLFDQLKERQGECAELLSQIDDALTADAARTDDNGDPAPLLDSAALSDVAAQLNLLKVGGTLVTGKEAVGFDVLTTMLTGITGS